MQMETPRHEYDGQMQMAAERCWRRGDIDSGKVNSGETQMMARCAMMAGR
jgi:hypothetical protein